MINTSNNLFMFSFQPDWRLQHHYSHTQASVRDSHIVAAVLSAFLDPDDCLSHCISLLMTSQISVSLDRMRALPADWEHRKRARGQRSVSVNLVSVLFSYPSLNTEPGESRCPAYKPFLGRAEDADSTLRIPENSEPSQDLRKWW